MTAHGQTISKEVGTGRRVASESVVLRLATDFALGESHRNSDGQVTRFKTELYSDVPSC